MQTQQAYPLQWPPGKPMSSFRKHNNHFKASFAESRDECFREIKRLGGTDAVISTNVKLKRDGRPEAVPWGKAIAGNPGVAVYFKRKGKDLCFACDCWHTVQDNMQAIVLTIAALRGIARWGTGDMMEAAFTGFLALPAPGQTTGIDPYSILGLARDNGVTEEGITAAFRSLAKKYHPDIPVTGDSSKWASIRAAHDLLMATHRKP